MLAKDIASLVLAHLSNVGLDPNEKPERYKQAATVKHLFCDGVTPREIVVHNSHSLELTMSKADYSTAIFNDLHFGFIRAKEQCITLKKLVDAEMHPAWILVTAYYACYFIANNLSKGSGRYVINLNKDELCSMFSAQAAGVVESFNPEENNSFAVSVQHGEMSGELIINLRKSSPRPHQLAWLNFSQLISKIKLDDSRVTHLTLLRSIASQQDGWQSPSAVRNKWNYTQTNYFGEKGVEVAKTFTSIIKSPSSAFRWAGNIMLKPTDENIAASIALMYHVLESAHGTLQARLNLT